MIHSNAIATCSIRNRIAAAALAGATVTGNIYNTNSAGDNNINKTLFVYPYTYS